MLLLCQMNNNIKLKNMIKRKYETGNLIILKKFIKNYSIRYRKE